MFLYNVRINLIRIKTFFGTVEEVSNKISCPILGMDVKKEENGGWLWFVPILGMYTRLRVSNDFVVFGSNFRVSGISLGSSIYINKIYITEWK